LPGPDVPEIRFADGTVGEAYKQEFSMSNDADPSDKFYFVMRDPEYSPLPPGLGLAKEGVISGVPTQQGEYTFELCGVGRDEECTIIDGKIKIYPKRMPPVAVLTGNFTGDFWFTDNMGNPLYRDTGKLTLRLEQEEDEISGEYTFSDIRLEQLHSLDQVQLATTAPDFSKKISGKLSGARIEFSDGWIEFDGGFDADKIILDFESCYLNGCCVNPEHAGYTGEATVSNIEGVPDVPAPSYDCEMGIVGKTTLYRVKTEVPQAEEPEEQQPVVQKPISIFNVPFNCIFKRDDVCVLFNCVFKECNCLDEGVVYGKAEKIDSKEKAAELVKEYAKGYTITSTDRLDDNFYNVYVQDTAGMETFYTVSSNGLVMKTDCG